MLKKIPKIIPPELFKIMMEMGHGDEIVIADGNFPSHSIGKKIVRVDSSGIPELLEAILHFFPLDSYVKTPSAIMDIVPGDTIKTPEIWRDYKRIIGKYEKNNKMQKMDKKSFYERSKKAYAVVATGEKALYANIILKKGVVKDE
jgi:L-fucose mutarotase